jgi:DNA-binding NarL/FixJ family response regulator
LKENGPDEIIAGVHAVSHGGTYVSAAMSVYLLERRLGAANAEGDILDCITPAERNLLKLIALGNTSKDIGHKLSLSYRTIENHRTNICRKLDIKGPNALLRFAVQHKVDL